MTHGPLIRAARLALVPFAARHLAPHYPAWLNDGDVVRYSEQRHRAHTLESCREFVAGFDDSPHHLWAVELASGGRHIGNVTAHRDPPNGVADIGILIGAKDLWGQGYGVEAWAALLEWLLGEGGVRKATAGTLATNKGMLGIMARTGMKEEARLKDHVMADGRAVDVILAARFRA